MDAAEPAAVVVALVLLGIWAGLTATTLILLFVPLAALLAWGALSS